MTPQNRVLCSDGTFKDLTRPFHTYFTDEKDQILAGTFPHAPVIVSNQTLISKILPGSVHDIRSHSKRRKGL